jgi:hypothetical protein
LTLNIRDRKKKEKLQSTWNGIDWIDGWWLYIYTIARYSRAAVTKKRTGNIRNMWARKVYRGNIRKKATSSTARIYEKKERQVCIRIESHKFCARKSRENKYLFKHFKLQQNLYSSQLLRTYLYNRLRCSPRLWLFFI